MRSLLSRLTVPVRDSLRRLRYAEPARLRAGWTMLLGLAGAAGLSVPEVVDRRVGVLIGAFAILAPYLQGAVTRKDVWSQRTVDDLTALIKLFPGAADDIQKMVGAGLEYRIIREHLEAQTPRHAAAGSPA